MADHDHGARSPSTGCVICNWSATSQAAGWLPEPWLDELAPSAEELALRSAEMSYGLMLLLERLKPDERAAFVLHEAFDCDYAEIARILERTPAACRQIVHRAKTRLQREGAPLQRPDPVAHARLVERLRTALEAQDRAGLLRLFSDAPEVVSDAPVRVSEPAVAAAAWMETVTRWLARWQRTSTPHAMPHAEARRTVSIDGTMGIALLNEGEIAALLDVSTSGGRIVALRIVTRAAPSAGRQPRLRVARRRAICSTRDPARGRAPRPQLRCAATSQLMSTHSTCMPCGVCAAIDAVTHRCASLIDR